MEKRCDDVLVLSRKWLIMKYIKACVPVEQYEKVYHGIF